MLAKTAGTARYCYNWGLAKWNEMHKNGESCSTCLLSRMWTKERPDWAKETYRGSQTRALIHLGGAFAKYFKRLAGEPHNHKKGKHDSFYLDNAHCWFKGDKRLHMPNIGDVRLAEKLRFSGKIQRFSVSKIADEWYVVITVDMDDAVPTDSYTAVGIDVGIKHWAVASNGSALDRPKSIDRLEKSLRHAEREKSRRKKGSKNRRKTIRRIRRLHHRLHCVKMDAVHKFTTTISKNHGIVCCENLCVAGMKKSMKAIRKGAQKSCMGEIRRVLAYKSLHYVEIDRWFPSSKRCSKCGHVKEDLGLDKRIYRCSQCGSVLDRDFNASVNIRDEGFRIFTEGHSESACGGR